MATSDDPAQVMCDKQAGSKADCHFLVCRQTRKFPLFSVNRDSCSPLENTCSQQTQSLPQELDGIQFVRISKVETFRNSRNCHFQKEEVSESKNGFAGESISDMPTRGVAPLPL